MHANKIVKPESGKGFTTLWLYCPLSRSAHTPTIKSEEILPRVAAVLSLRLKLALYKSEKDHNGSSIKGAIILSQPETVDQVDGCSCIIKIRLVANSLILSDLSSSQFDLACLAGDAIVNIDFTEAWSIPVSCAS